MKLLKQHSIAAFLFTAVFLVTTVISCDNNDGTGPQIPPTSFKVTVTNVSSVKPVIKSGTFSSPGPGDIGPDKPALFPGESASFTFHSGTTIATPLPGTGEHLNIATMFVQSNDLFYAFPPEGLDLYDQNGSAIGANGPVDVTDQLVLYDAGTEEDTAPGTGPDQKPAQGPMTTDQGPKENENINPVSSAPTNSFTYPDKSDVIKITIEHSGDTQFTVTITNVSKPGTINSQRAGGSVPLSPGAWAVYDNAFQRNNGPFQFFQVGQPASKGIELIAEDGFPADKLDDGNIDTPIDMGLADALAKATGITNPLSPPVIVSHRKGFSVFKVGEKAGEGVETVAEDGFPASMLPNGKNLPPEPNEALVDILKGRDEVRSVGAAPNPGGNVLALEPAKPGQPEGESGSFTVKASPGDRLNFVTMYVQSNDFFYAFGGPGLDLFKQNGQPISGNVTDQVQLYDAGTEVDEEPGVGPNQKARQGFTNLDVGQDENGVIQTVVPAGASGGSNDGFNYPANAKVIRVTITPQQ